MRRVDRPHGARHRSATGAGPSRIQTHYPEEEARHEQQPRSADRAAWRRPSGPARSGVRGPAARTPGIGAVHLPNRTEGVDHERHRYRHRRTERARRPSPTPRRPAPAALPYLAVGDAREAIAWYIDTFGASLVGDMYEMDDGRIGHAELADRRRGALPGRRVPRARPESACPASGFGEPDAVT